MAAFRRRSIFGKFRSSQVSRASASPTAAFFFLVFIFGHFMSSDIAFSARPSPLVGIRILKLVRDNDLWSKSLTSFSRLQSTFLWEFCVRCIFNFWLFGIFEKLNSAGSKASRRDWTYASHHMALDFERQGKRKKKSRLGICDKRLIRVDQILSVDHYSTLRFFIWYIPILFGKPFDWSPRAYAYAGLLTI